MSAHKLLIHSARQIVTFKAFKACTGAAMTQVHTLQAEYDSSCNQLVDGYCVVVNADGSILEIGKDSVLLNQYRMQCDQVIDATGLCIIPGLVDGHTHPVWAGDRVHEFAMKLAGATYMDIHKAGGGIMFTVDKTREASEEELYQSFKERMKKLLKSGVTMVECKSGYGLDYDTELKMLKVINRAIKDPDVKMDVSITYCGAHAVPKGASAEEATDDIVNKQIPQLKDLCNGAKLRVDNIDVFCEKGVYNVDQTRRILEAGKAAGWSLNFHAEELSCLNSVEMGAELGAVAMSHLEEISDDGILAMAERGCVAVILPTTAYLLHLKPPPVRKMIEKGVAVALGTDFNPNAYCLTMPLVMNLACVTLGMTMPEALCAATINAAASLNKAESHGSIEVGKIADLVLLDCQSWEHLIYQMGNSDCIKHVVKAGELVYTA